MVMQFFWGGAGRGVNKVHYGLCDSSEFRPQSLRYPFPAERATNALEESKIGTTKSWFRFNCACVKLFTHLTKRSSLASTLLQFTL